MRYVVTLATLLVVVTLLLASPTSVSAQGSTARACNTECAFFRMLISIPTTGDLAADLAGLIALATSLLTLARFTQGTLPLPLQKSSETPLENGEELEEMIEEPAQVTEIIGID
jgi:hypothetical protein